jgi:hypothetical protein
LRKRHKWDGRFNIIVYRRRYISGELGLYIETMGREVRVKRAAKNIELFSGYKSIRIR